MLPTRISQVLASPAFREGARDMRAVGLGVSAWGLVTGVAMVKSGLSVGLALIISLTVFAGSAQLAALPLIAAGAPLLLVLGAAFCVNLRFVVFSAQMRPYLERLSLRRRLAYGYLIGDVNLVMMLRRYPVADGSATQTQYFLGGGLTNWAFWQVPSIVGILLADLFPDSWGVAFAGTLALLAIVLGLMANRAVAGIIIMASALSTALFWMPLKLNLVLAILLALMVGMSWDAWAQRRTGLAI